jgi:hypothetical protein
MKCSSEEVPAPNPFVELTHRLNRLNWESRSVFSSHAHTASIVHRDLIRGISCYEAYYTPMRVAVALTRSLLDGLCPINVALPIQVDPSEIALHEVGKETAYILRRVVDEDKKPN